MSDCEACHGPADVPHYLEVEHPGSDPEDTLLTAVSLCGACASAVLATINERRPEGVIHG